MSSDKLFTTSASQSDKVSCNLDILQQQQNLFNKNLLFKQGFNAVNNLILILNTSRQVVFVNKAFLTAMNINDEAEVLGQKMGTIFKCIHVDNQHNGCGTAETCTYCNGMNVLLKAMASNTECSGEFSTLSMLKGFEDKFNALLHVAPLIVADDVFYILSIVIHGDSVRKKMLERIFFHDIVNTAGALKGMVGLLKIGVTAEMKPEVEFIEKNFGHLIEEIQAQQNVMEVENNQFVSELTAIDSFDVLSSTSKLYAGHELFKAKKINIDPHSTAISFYVDYKLLRRILGNMLKNALEATSERGIVTIGCSVDEHQKSFIRFWVHNANHMDKMAQDLIFQRSFSTKADSRGLGTYSINLLGTKYLNGTVGFSSNETEGTTFYITIPLHTELNC